jgi:hypothetical protein
MLPQRELLKSKEGLIQLYKCPLCFFMVKQTDIIWKKRPNRNLRLRSSEGKIECCVYCKKLQLL